MPYWACGVDSVPSRASSSSRSFCAWLYVRILVTARPFFGSGLQMTTRRRFAMVCSVLCAKIAMSAFLVVRRRPTPVTSIGKSRAMSRTERPYSWYSARAIRWRTSSLPLTLIGSAVMKSMISSSASEATASSPTPTSSNLNIVRAEPFHLRVLPLLSYTRRAVPPSQLQRIPQGDPMRRARLDGGRYDTTAARTPTGWV